ncbi:ABC-2 transporter permease [Acetivibrio clariflavus]|uniref:ABC-2 transporter permease n=1 Tax=Acetivibrio clariflavus TaxID=288965 RepID=UPI000483657E|nr:ABC-2 transporter permease [Acetivibrio clariflavus]
MKALLLKDCYTLMKQIKFYIMMIILFAITPGNSISSIAMFYAALLPVTALAYDERSKWNSLALMMPYSDESIIGSKYILGYISVAAASLLSITAQIALNLVKNSTLEMESIFTVILIACVATVVQAFNLPFMFKFGVEKGRLAFFVLIAITAAMGVLFGDRLSGIFSSSNANIFTVMLVAVIFTVVVNLISVSISINIYKKRA